MFHDDVFADLVRRVGDAPEGSELRRTLEWDMERLVRFKGEVDASFDEMADEDPGWIPTVEGAWSLTRNWRAFSGYKGEWEDRWKYGAALVSYAHDRCLVMILDNGTGFRDVQRGYRQTVAERLFDSLEQLTNSFNPDEIPLELKVQDWVWQIEDAFREKFGDTPDLVTGTGQLEL